MIKSDVKHFRAAGDYLRRRWRRNAGSGREEHPRMIVMYIQTPSAESNVQDNQNEQQIGSGGSRPNNNLQQSEDLHGIAIVTG